MSAREVPVEVWLEICKLLRDIDIADFELRGRPQRLHWGTSTPAYSTQSAPGSSTTSFVVHHPPPYDTLSSVSPQNQNEVAPDIDTSASWDEEPIVSPPSLLSLATTCRFYRTIVYPILFERVRAVPSDLQNENSIERFQKRVHALVKMSGDSPRNHIRDLSIHSHDNAKAKIGSTIVKLIKHLPKLCRLELITVVLSEDVISALHSLDTLRHFKMIQCSGSNRLDLHPPVNSVLDLRSFQAHVHRWRGSPTQLWLKSFVGPNLTHFCMKTSTLHLADWPTLPNLLHLKVDDSHTLSEDDLGRLFYILEGSPQLEALEIPRLPEDAEDLFPPLPNLRSITCDPRDLVKLISGRPVERVDVGRANQQSARLSFTDILSASTKPIKALRTSKSILGVDHLWRSDKVRAIVEAQPWLEELEFRLVHAKEIPEALPILAQLRYLRKLTLGLTDWAMLDFEWQTKKMRDLLKKTQSPFLNEVSLVQGRVWHKTWPSGSWVALAKGEHGVTESPLEV